MYQKKIIQGLDLAPESGSALLYDKIAPHYGLCRSETVPISEKLQDPESTEQSGYTVKKGLADSRPQPGCHLPKSPWPGRI